MDAKKARGKRPSTSLHAVTVRRVLESVVTGYSVSQRGGRLSCMYSYVKGIRWEKRHIQEGRKKFEVNSNFLLARLLAPTLLSLLEK